MTELHQLASEPPPAPAARSAIRVALGRLAAHATARAATARRALDRREARRVWLFIAVLGVMASGAMVAYIAPITDAARPIGLPWPLLALGFLAAESKVIVVHFRRETHSFSLSEVPAVLGLFFLSPTDYLLASLVGSGAALIAARQSFVKLTFNLANFAAIAVLQLVIFHGIGRFDAVPTPVDWLAAFAAMVAGSVFSVFTIATAISLSGGAPQFQKLPEMIRFGSLVALANTSLALLAVTVMWIEPSAAWLLVIPLGALYLAYRAYVSEREKHERLELLYQSSRILQHSPELDSALVALLDHARGMFRSELAEIILYPRTAGRDALRTTSLHEGQATVMLPEPEDRYAAVRARLEVAPGARFQVAADGSAWSGPPLREAMLSPLVGDSGQIGLMRVANRLTAGTGFEEDDLRLLETLANQAAVALENGQLEQSLAELSRLKEELRYQAYHDPLTGLANRVMFAEQVERRLAGLPPGAVAAVLFLDLDDFKLVNDTLGHAAGDRLLAGVGERIRGCIRAEDVAARLGGDEFGILLVDDAGLGRAKAVAARIIETLQVPFPLHGRELVIGGSLGIAVGHRAGERADDLLRNADVAMYTAKAGGKGRVAVFDPRMHAALIARHELSAELSRSIGRGELVVYYQPIVELATGRPTAVEALVRWRHPTRGLVAPDEFIPLAEENGTILALGRWVLAEACRQAAAWIRGSDLEPGFSISVNLSSLQLQQPDFIDEIERVLALTGLPPDRLILELTETAMFGDTEGAIAKLSALRARGVRIAVDDFGTGYSSLGYLRRFPVDILKIAREFVVPADRDADEWAFAHAILALGRTLGLRIVAEGIEERGQADRLIELGCEFGQGYQFGRPEPAERVVEIARAGREVAGRARPAGLRAGEAGA